MDKVGRAKSEWKNSRKLGIKDRYHKAVNYIYILEEKVTGLEQGKETLNKKYIAVCKDNEVIADISVYGDEPIIIKNGYEIVQSDEPMEFIDNGDGKIFLYE